MNPTDDQVRQAIGTLFHAADCGMLTERNYEDLIRLRVGHAESQRNRNVEQPVPQQVTL